MDILWALFLWVWDFIWPVLYPVLVVFGIWMLWKLIREIKNLRAERGDTAAMKLEFTRYKAKVAGILSVVLGITAVGGAIMLGVTNVYAVLLAGAVVFFPLISWSLRLNARCKEGFKQNFVAVELSKVFANLKYDHAGTFPDDEIAGLGLFAFADSIGGSDLIEADYKGTHFKQSDLHVQEVWTETKTDGDGCMRDVTRRRDVFKGRVMKFDFADAFKGEVRVTSRNFDGDGYSFDIRFSPQV